jgi:hypothetical protein
MSILDTIKNFFYQIICSIYNKLERCQLITSPESTESITSTICPRDTCIHQHSDEDFTIPYSTELNLNSNCDDIKDYILTNLERSHPNAFHSSDDTPITYSMKKELIFVLENSSSLIEEENGNLTPGIRFKFCCPTEQNCLLK